MHNDSSRLGALAAIVACVGCNAVFGISKGDLSEQDGGAGSTINEAGAGSAGAPADSSAESATPDAKDDSEAEASTPPDDMSTSFIDPTGEPFDFSISNWNAATQQEEVVTVSAQLNYTFDIDTYEVSVRRYNLWAAAGFPVPQCSDLVACDLDSRLPELRWLKKWDIEVKEPDFVNCTGPSHPKVTAAMIRQDEFNPMVCLNWYQALALCVHEGKRLPTETEWMFVATSGGDNKNLQYPFPGGKLDCDHATFDPGEFNYCGFPRRIGSAFLGATQDDVMDMAGSVFEWVWDEFEPYPLNLTTNYTGGHPAIVNPTRIRHGGAFISTEGEDRLSNWSRDGQWEADAFHNDAGFRCVTVPK